MEETAEQWIDKMSKQYGVKMNSQDKRDYNLTGLVPSGFMDRLSKAKIKAEKC